MSQDYSRNVIMRLNLIASSGAFIMGTGALIAGLFGSFRFDSVFILGKCRLPERSCGVH
jgi:hypothetical protein